MPEKPSCNGFRQSFFILVLRMGESVLMDKPTDNGQHTGVNRQIRPDNGQHKGGNRQVRSDNGQHRRVNGQAC